MSTLATIRSSALVAFLILAVFGSVKKHQDLDEQAFVRLQVAQAHASADSSRPAEKAAGQLLLEHRNALLNIAEQERALRQQQASGSSAARSIEEMIKRNVEHLTSGAFVRSKVADNPQIAYETQRSHEIEKALNLDSTLLIISSLALVFGISLWIVEFQKMISSAKRVK